MSLEGDADAPGRDEEAAIVYTSAMAGIPLGAILTHENLLANARSTVVAAKNTSDDRVLAVLPFAHLFGLTVTAGAPLLAGGRVVTMAKFNPARAAELVASGAITEIVGVPTVFRAMAAAIEKRGEGVGVLRLCICGGAPLSEAFQDRWATLTGVELRQGYGLTEAGPVCLFNGVDAPNQRSSLGRPFPGVEVDLRAPVAYDALGLATESVDAHRDAEGEILDTVRELGITFVPYSPLARGLVTATVSDKDSLPSDDYRRTLPRFDAEHWENNQQLVNEFAELAAQKNCTPAQLALAWVLAQGEDIVPIPGTKKRKYLEENAAAVDVTLSNEDLQNIEKVISKYPNTGNRYSEGALKLVNH
jgi:acyl-CoA synthetase (AMP-forming)/AMP-acid ligase II